MTKYVPLLSWIMLLAAIVLGIWIYWKYPLKPSCQVIENQPSLSDSDCRWTEYEGGCLDGLAHGRGIAKTPYGRKYEGEFYQGRFQGLGKMYETDGEIAMGRFKNGLKEGPFIFTAADGSREQWIFAKGELRDGWRSLTKLPPGAPPLVPAEVNSWDNPDGKSLVIFFGILLAIAIFGCLVWNFRVEKGEIDHIGFPWFSAWRRVLWVIGKESFWLLVGLAIAAGYDWIDVAPIADFLAIPTHALWFWSFFGALSLAGMSLIP